MNTICVRNGCYPHPNHNTKNPNQKFATEAEILTEILTLRRPCEMLGRLRRSMIE